MTNKQPPFEINERIMADVIEIAELVGRVSVTDKISMNPTLRRTNRIQTIYSSLAIEQNTLDIYFCRINIYDNKRKVYKYEFRRSFSEGIYRRKGIYN